jgi:hypothetical protein
MISKASNVEDYIEGIPDSFKPAFVQLRNVVKKNLPKGFQEQMIYGSLGFVVPHKTYPNGYHCDPTLPLPFLNIAAQKNFIALYHMGIYADPKLLKWFTEEYPKHCKFKLDMGKSCIRFKKPDDIPFKLIGELVAKMSPTDWIACYEKSFRSK